MAPLEYDGDREPQSDSLSAPMLSKIWRTGEDPLMFDRVEIWDVNGNPLSTIAMDVDTWNRASFPVYNRPYPGGFGSVYHGMDPRTMRIHNPRTVNKVDRWGYKYSLTIPRYWLMFREPELTDLHGLFDTAMYVLCDSSFPNVPYLRLKGRVMSFVDHGASVRANRRNPWICRVSYPAIHDGPLESWLMIRKVMRWDHDERSMLDTGFRTAHLVMKASDLKAYLGRVPNGTVWIGFRLQGALVRDVGKAMEYHPIKLNDRRRYSIKVHL